MLPFPSKPLVTCYCGRSLVVLLQGCSCKWWEWEHRLQPNQAKGCLAGNSLGLACVSALGDMHHPYPGELRELTEEFGLLGKGEKFQSSKKITKEGRGDICYQFVNCFTPFHLTHAPLTGKKLLRLAWAIETQRLCATTLETEPLFK